MSRYVRVDRGAGSRAGQLLRHVDDPSRWQVVVFIGRDAKGRKKYRSQVVHGRKRDAEAVLTDLLQTKNQGRLAPRTSSTVADLAREWLSHKAREVTPRTLRGYRDMLTNYVLPSIGHRRLADLGLREIDALYGAMRDGALPTPDDDSGGWQGGALSARTIRLAHTALHQALSQAVKWGMIPFNPSTEATIPSGKPKEKRALTVAERAAFIAASDEAFYRLLYRLLMDTGMRPGEACALKWSDVDFEGERITVSRAITRGANGERVAAHPKTSKSRRTLPMFGLRDDLLVHYRWQSEVGLDRSGHVFTNQDGGIIAPWTLGKRELARVSRAAGINWNVTLYTFRHTFATLHLQSGTPLKVVSDWLGHSTIQQTANTYQHLSVDVAMDYAERHTAWLAEASRAAQGVPLN